MACVTIRQLKLEDVALVYPLVRLHQKHLTLAEWTNYARGVLFEENEVNSGGFVLACDCRGTIYGLVQYQKRLGAGGGAEIIETNMMAAGLFQKHRLLLTTALRQALSQMAQESGCTAYIVEDPARRPLGIPLRN